MLNDKFKGYRVISSTYCRLQDDEFWAVEQKLVQERSKDGKDWERKEANSSARAKNMEDALGQVYLSMATFLETVKGDLFAELDEGKEKELLN